MTLNTLKKQYARTRTLLLDMDGTLLDLHFDSYFWNEHLPRRFAEIHNEDLVTAKRSLADRLRSHEGTLAWYDTAFWASEFNLDIIALKSEVKHKIAYRPGTQAFLKSIRNLDLRVILVTNADLPVLTLKHKTIGILDHLDNIVSSHHYGYAKESQDFWHALNDEYTIEKASTMLIDDSHAVLASAMKFGISHTVCVQSPDSQQRDLNDPAQHSPINDLNELLR